MLKRAYDWCLASASHPLAPGLLFILAFAQSSLSPVPLWPLLIPMGIARPDRVWWYAALCVAGSVLGGYVGYAIGAVLFETLGSRVIAFYGLQDKAGDLIAAMQDYWFWVLVVKSLTPIPFKIIAIMSGFLRFDLWQFTAGIVISRAVYFVIIAGVFRFYGDDIRIRLERRLPEVILVLFVATAVGILTFLIGLSSC